MFPVRYELNSYINLLRNSVFKGLNKVEAEQIRHTRDVKMCQIVHKMVYREAERERGLEVSSYRFDTGLGQECKRDRRLLLTSASG
jgi:hypothetical protein